MTSSRFDIERLLQEANDTLKADLQRHPVLVTESLDAGNASRESLAAILIGFLKCPFICVVSAATLALLNSGSNSGLVIDMGASATEIVPIYERSVVRDAARRLDWLAGKEVDGYMFSLAGGLSQDKRPLERARATKERLCRVAFHYTEEVDLLKVSPPDEAKVAVELENDDIRNKPVLLTHELIQAPEMLFRPQLNGKLRAQGLPDAIVGVVQSLEPSLRPLLCKNIVLAGRGAQFKGLPERLTMELADRLPPACDFAINLALGIEEGSSAYHGACKLASSPTFRSMCLSRDEYAVSGSARMFWAY